MAPATALLSLAVLSATGTGVTLRVLAQGQDLPSPSGRVLVGVSVLDELPAIARLGVTSAMAGQNLGAQGAPPMAAMALGLVLAWLSHLARLAQTSGLGS